MIISTKKGTPKEELEKIVDKFEKQGLDVTLITGKDYNVFGLVGDTTKIDERDVLANPWIDNVTRVSAPYKRANRLFHPDDTVVDVNGEVFGKPHSVEDAKRMLRALSGATHAVHTGVCVSDGKRTESFVDSCRVTFFPLSEEEIDFYASTQEPYDKAGAYAIQGRAALWLDRIEGDYYTIMGLPVSRTVQLVECFV